MYDTMLHPIMTAAATTTLLQEVRNAFELYRDGQILALSRVPLASSVLVEGCFFPDDVLTSDARGRAMGAVLAWAVERLRPSGESVWGAYQWRTYNVLFHFYLHRMRVVELAERMAVTEQTIYEARATALAEVTRVLHEELRDPQDGVGRRRAYFSERYARLAFDEQMLLRLLALFRHPIAPLVPVQLLEAGGRGVRSQRYVGSVTALSGLIASGLVVSDDERNVIHVHADVRPFVLALLGPEERQTWHRTIAHFYRSHHRYLEAAIHYRLGGLPQVSADLLIEHYRNGVDDLSLGELRELLDAFRPTDVSEMSWAQVKILSGGVAEAMQDVDTAIAEYGRALGAREPQVKALAYYRRGRMLKQKNIDEALVHYHHCVQVLRAANVSGALLVRAYIGKAWIAFEEHQDLAQAEVDLHQAQALVEHVDLETLAELQNTWGEFYFHAGDLRRARDAHLECHRIATEIQHVELNLKSLHNLGLIYAEQRQYRQGLAYLLKCRAFAAQAGHRRMEGLSDGSIGACYFWLAEYEQAVQFYHRAREIFIAMGNRNWQAGGCYDLTEAYAKMGQWSQARQYFDEGMAIINELNLERHRRSFQALAEQYPDVLHSAEACSERQVNILAFVKAHGAIKSTECARLLGLSKEQAIRALNDLVERRLLVRVGVARATRYTVATGDSSRVGE